jgi:hypothetical protein
MRGGSTTSGFGDILGNALSLLYVARQGLKEQELWKVLDYLQAKAKHQKEFTKEKKQMLKERKDMMRRNAESILKRQALIEVVFRAEDIGRSGYLTLDQLYVATLKFVYFDKSDLLTMLDFIVANISPSQLDLDGKFQEDEFINYSKFFAFLSKVYRRFHTLSNNSKYSDKTAAINEEEAGWNEQFDDDYENFVLKDHGNEDLSEAVKQDEVGANSGDRNMSSLGPVVEELLLHALCSLGVLYSPENKVLILPCDSELFRQTIFNRYILPRGGGNIQYWHNLIIQYFRTQPNSLRKCEEMPWHLKICRKWTSLKDSLVDLKTFDLMFNNDLRDELMEYWLLLTEGPLYVTDPQTLAQSRGNEKGNFKNSSTIFSQAGNIRKTLEDDDDDNDSTFSHILREIDESIALKVSVKDIKKRIFKYQVDLPSSLWILHPRSD